MNTRNAALKWAAQLASLAVVLAATGRAALGQAQTPAQQPAPAASQGGQAAPAGQNGQAAPAAQNGQAAPATRGGQAAPAGQTAPPKPQVTPEEAKAYAALRNELDPARQIELVDQFAKTYPSSLLLSDVYFLGAYACQQQGDLNKVIAYGSKSLQANPDNWKSLLTMATMLPEPQLMAQEGDAQKEKSLSDAETDANRALQLLTTISPGKLTPEQFAQLKTTVNVQAHEALGMVHMQRATMGLAGPDAQELAKAEQEYKTANADGQPNPADFFRLGEIYQMENKVDDAIAAFTQASKLGQGTAIQNLADQQIESLKKQKGQSQAPAKP